MVYMLYTSFYNKYSKSWEKQAESRVHKLQPFSICAFKMYSAVYRCEQLNLLLLKHLEIY